MTFIGDPPVSGGNGNEGIGGGNQYVATRLSQGGWAQVSISASGYANEYVGFSGDFRPGSSGLPNTWGKTHRKATPTSTAARSTGPRQWGDRANRFVGHSNRWSQRLPAFRQTSLALS